MATIFSDLPLLGHVTSHYAKLDIQALSSLHVVGLQLTPFVICESVDAFHFFFDFSQRLLNSHSLLYEIIENLINIEGAWQTLDNELIEL